MISLFIEQRLMAKCLVTDNVNTTINNALTLCCTSSVYNNVIKSEKFFKNIIELIDPNNPLCEGKIVDSSEENSSFKSRYFNLRNVFFLKTESFPGIFFGVALASEDGIEVVSFNDEHDEIVAYKLKENLEPKAIKIPESMRIPSREVWKESPFAARS